MNKNTSISLGNYFENFVQQNISQGRFKNASEVIRAGLRFLEEEENRVIALKRAIHEGQLMNFSNRLFHAMITGLITLVMNIYLIFQPVNRLNRKLIRILKDA